ncbi:uncharacterized protein LOC105798029 isoform X2 [Gossypium raimondii]|uniref:uncharacterized protein LOC105798029 isoform X2 n=1 Tax=Gossypium raimondii TaxID=29730 RepID=UPI00227B406A|nr:uncharacterized protein LOC105798029 isoform X2 [Gossypium raimondii]
MELKLALGEWSGRFDMEKAVCNHGFFMMSPNLWIPSTKSLRRPLRLADSTRSVPVTISHPLHHPFLLIQVHHSPISSADEAVILEQVGRMLRISKKDERDVTEFQEMHSSARENGLGRIFRSPSFFEDAVKSILLCNCSWKRSLDMARDLCLLQPKIALDGNARSKRKRSKCSDDIGNFPSWKELVAWSWVDEKYLIKQCNVGYRAARILQLATMFAQGDLREDHIAKLEQSSDPTSFETLYQKLLKIKGFGPFVCSNIMMCVGFYQRIPSDSETIRYMASKIALNRQLEKMLRKFMANIIHFNAWHTGEETRVELIEEYENKFGKLSKLEAGNYHLITAPRYLGTRE